MGNWVGHVSDAARAQRNSRAATWRSPGPTPHFMLEAQNLAARRGFVDVFTGLTFRVDVGEALLVTGANGTGKTTLLRMLAGLCAPGAGEIRWNGQAGASVRSGLRAARCFAGHLPALKDELTAEENLASLVALDGDAGDQANRFARRSTRLRCRASVRFRRGCCRKASAGASASRG